MDVRQLFDLCNVSSKKASLLKPYFVPGSQPSILLCPEPFGALWAPDHLSACAVNFHSLLLILSRLLGSSFDGVRVWA